MSKRIVLPAYLENKPEETTKFSKTIDIKQSSLSDNDLIAQLPPLSSYDISLEPSSPSALSKASYTSDVFKQLPLSPYAQTSTDDEQDLDKLSGKPDTINNNKSPIYKLKEGVKSLKHALPIINNEYSPDCVSVRLRSHKFSGSYLEEVSTGKITSKYGNKFYIPPMTKEELAARRLSYDPTTRLLTHKDHSASTLGKTGKGKADAEAFVLSKYGRLFLFEHSERDVKGASASHGSVLGEKPVEMAGVMKVINGKITYIDCDSGHYAPTQLDMYRAIKAFQQKMPGALHEECQIAIPQNELKQLQETQVSLNVMSLGDFMQYMEREISGKPYHQMLRDERIAKHEAENVKLQNIRKVINNPGLQDLVEQISGHVTSASAFKNVAPSREHRAQSRGVPSRT